MIQKDRVLVVDDEPMNVRVMAVHLEAKGYEVLKAYNGEEALRITREAKPDLILLDIIMPGMDGYEVTARLRKDPETTIIPIVLVTGLQGTEDKVKGLNAGADDFLIKPVKQAELLARVRSLLKLKRLHEEVMAKSNLPPHLITGSDDSRQGKSIILIVEDDERAAKNYGLILGTAGYDIITAATEKEAEEILNEAVPDLILLDIMLPDKSGLELLALLRGESGFENIPIIIISSIDDLETKVKGIDTGADDYLVKPVNALELIARVKSNLKKYEIQQRLKKNVDQLFVQSITDQLTGLCNRHYLQTVIEREIAAAKRYGSGFSLLLFDIDHFKSVNDTYGHLAGDSVLRELGRIVKDDSRTSDVVARYGGEEFVVLLPNTAKEAAVAVAEKLRKTVADFGFANVEGRAITISIGVTEGLAADDRMESVVKRADEVLYRAKQKGRNRAEVAECPAAELQE